MKIVADENIPFLKELLPNDAELILKPGRDIQRHDLIDADILMTRTVTPVNADLLANTAVKFVGTATAGYDHLDTSWLTDNGIAWAYAPGVNATAVAEYVICCIAYLQTQNVLSPQARIGVIGVGHIGAKVAKRLQTLGLDVLLNDPPRAAQESHFYSTPLSQFQDLDCICLHTPLTTTGSFPTHHLLNESFLKTLNPSCVLLNAGRGAVIDNVALAKSSMKTICLDVWENEPNIVLSLLEKATIATPHIAGYSLQAKFQAVYMIYEKIKKHFHFQDAHPEDFLMDIRKKIKLPVVPNDTWQTLALKIYNPVDDTQIMKKTLLSASDPARAFETLRQHYAFRNEFSVYDAGGALSEMRLGCDW